MAREGGVFLGGIAIFTPKEHDFKFAGRKRGSDEDDTPDGDDTSAPEPRGRVVVYVLCPAACHEHPAVYYRAHDSFEIHAGYTELILPMKALNSTARDIASLGPTHIVELANSHEGSMRHDARGVRNGQHVLGDAGSLGEGRCHVHAQQSAVQAPGQTQTQRGKTRTER